MRIVIVGGSDAGISAALRAQEVAPSASDDSSASRFLSELQYLRIAVLLERRDPGLEATSPSNTI